MVWRLLERVWSRNGAGEASLVSLCPGGLGSCTLSARPPEHPTQHSPGQVDWSRPAVQSCPSLASVSPAGLQKQWPTGLSSCRSVGGGAGVWLGVEAAGGQPSPTAQLLPPHPCRLGDFPGNLPGWVGRPGWGRAGTQHHPHIALGHCGGLNGERPVSSVGVAGTRPPAHPGHRHLIKGLSLAPTARQAPAPHQQRWA